MIQPTVLDRILIPSREPRRAAKISSGGGFAVPVIREHAVTDDDLPLLCTSMRSFIVPGAKDGVTRSGFMEIGIDEEPELLRCLFEALWRLSVAREWPNRCTSLGQARARMEALGDAPIALLIPLSWIQEVAGVDVSEEDAGKLMVSQGFIAEIDGLRVLPGVGLPDRHAMLVTLPVLAGEYTRADTHVSLLIRRADRSFVLVREESGESP